MKITRAFVALAAVVAFIATLSVFSFGQSESPRITQQISESNGLRLFRNTRPEANAKNDRGAVSDALDLDHMLLVLQRSPEQEQELERLIDSLNDKATRPISTSGLLPNNMGSTASRRKTSTPSSAGLSTMAFASTRSTPTT